MCLQKKAEIFFKGKKEKWLPMPKTLRLNIGSIYRYFFLKECWFQPLKYNRIVLPESWPLFHLHYIGITLLLVKRIDKKTWPKSRHFHLFISPARRLPYIFSISRAQSHNLGSHTRLNSGVTVVEPDQRSNLLRIHSRNSR